MVKKEEYWDKVKRGLCVNCNEKPLKNRRYCKNHKEAKKKWSARWYNNNPDYAKEWREKNPDYFPKYLKKYYKDHKKKIKMVGKKWRKNNPNYYKRYREDKKKSFFQMLFGK